MLRVPQGIRRMCGMVFYPITFLPEGRFLAYTRII